MSNNHSQFSIINSIEELSFLMAEKVSSRNSVIMEIPISELRNTTVICLSDIALQLNYKECGIMVSQETIRLSFNVGEDNFCGCYLTQDKTVINLFETYTVQISLDSVFNLISKANGNCYEFIIKRENNETDNYFWWTLLFLFLSIIISGIVVVFKLKKNMYLNEEENV